MGSERSNWAEVESLLEATVGRTPGKPVAYDVKRLVLAYLSELDAQRKRVEHCQRCGALFTTRRRNRIYCSLTCAQTAAKIAWRGRKRENCDGVETVNSP